MGKQHESRLRKTALASAITATISTTCIPGIVLADIYTWGGTLGTSCAASPQAASVFFTMQDNAGELLANSSLPGGTIKNPANNLQTPTCGTLTYDTETQSGTVDIAAFDFFGNDPSLPAEATGINISKIPAGQDNGHGSLILANMLFNWNGTVGIPVSLVWDATSMLGEMDGTPSTFTLNADGTINSASALSGTGGIPATDGIYVDATGATTGLGLGPGGYPGYLALGPSPLATTAWNTSLATGCQIDNCLGVNPSGALPLVEDAVDAAKDYSDNLGSVNGTSGAPSGVGGFPMVDGPFKGSNANFDFTSMTLTSFTDTTAPILTILGNNPLTHTEGDAFTDPGATCIDAAPLGTNLNASIVTGGDTIDNTTTAGAYSITYDCQDPSGNAAATETRIVNVVGAGVPSITLLGVTPVTHECATTYTDAGATASDPEDGDISTDIVATPNDGVTLTLGVINEGTVSTQTIDYDVQDSGGNSAPTVTRTVNVVDTTSPVITLLPGTGGATTPEDVVSWTLQNPATYIDPGADATDTCDTVGFPQTISATSGTVDMIVPDDGAVTISYSLGYSATDSEGNTGTATRTVNVTRSQPVITLSDGMGGVGGGLILNVGDTYTEQGMDIIDAQDLPGSQITVTTSGSSSGLTYTIDSSSVDTTTPGNYSVTYNATDSDGNLATQVTRSVQVGVFASGSNFSMLDSNGNVFGGTNDVVFDWDGTSFNTDETDTNFGLMEIASAKPQEFFGFVWTAHNIRVYQGPATLTFDTTCTVAQLEAGMSVCNGPLDPGQTEQFMTMTIAAGQIGAHILFDWNTSTDIDVVNVWDIDGVWDRHGGADSTNKLWDGPAGTPPDPDTTWKLVSTDFDGDNINGSPMLDGPFQGSNANFNAGPSATAGPQEPYTGTAPDTKLGNSIFVSPVSLWTLFGGLLSLVGLRRFKINNKNIQ